MVIVKLMVDALSGYGEENPVSQFMTREVAMRKIGAHFPKIFCFEHFTE